MVSRHLTAHPVMLQKLAMSAKERKRPHYRQTFQYLYWILIETLRWQKVKKPARLSFEDKIKALYIFFHWYCAVFADVRFTETVKTLNALGLRYTFQTILLSTSSSVLLLVLVASMPLNSTQAAPWASLKLQVLSYMQNSSAHKSLIFLAGLNVASGWWCKFWLNIEIVYWCEPLTKQLRVNPDWYTLLNNVWHWQSEHGR